MRLPRQQTHSVAFFGNPRRNSQCTQCPSHGGKSLSSDDLLRSTFLLGLFFLLLGIALIALPMIVRLIPQDPKVPRLLIYVYRRGNFYFVTSPVLIIISVVSLLIFLWRNMKA